VGRCDGLIVAAGLVAIVGRGLLGGGGHDTDSQWVGKKAVLSNIY
jgi:hypothetical protein